MSRRSTLSEHSRILEHATTAYPDAPPDYMQNFSPEHRQIWDQYIECKAPADWDPGDLRLLAQAVYLEVFILSTFADIERNGIVGTGSSGQQVVNPAVSTLQKLTQSQGAILRRLGISISGTVAPRDVRKNADLARKIGPRETDDPADDLLAH